MWSSIKDKAARLVLAAAFWAVVPSGTNAQVVVTGADGSDDVFNPTANTVVDLSKASNARWDMPSPEKGRGVYDSNKWAVVFKYSSVNIPNGVKVTFSNHRSGAPVVWLVSGSVRINGVVSVDGASGTRVGAAPGGPGGFRGSQAAGGSGAGSAGFGPGGGAYTAGAGSYATRGEGNSGAIYGNARLLPLIGGSGGSPRYIGFGCQLWMAGGGGGGAILIATPRTLELNGSITAYGGGAEVHCQLHGAGGAGGGIRLIADRVLGSGQVRALGGLHSGQNPLTGGDGRIRIEANQIVLADLGFPNYIPDFPGNVAQVWPREDYPFIRVLSVDNQDAAFDPNAALGFPQDAIINNDQPVPIILEAEGMPLDWNVRIRFTVADLAKADVAAQFVSGDVSKSMWRADTVFPKGVTVIQVLASGQ